LLLHALAELVGNERTDMVNSAMLKGNLGKKKQQEEQFTRLNALIEAKEAEVETEEKKRRRVEESNNAKKEKIKMLKGKIKEREESVKAQENLKKIEEAKSKNECSIINANDE